MKITATIHTAATSTSHGTFSFAFASEQARLEHLVRIFCDDASDEQKAQFLSGELDLDEYVGEESNFNDTFTTGETDLELDVALPGSEETPVQVAYRNAAMGRLHDEGTLEVDDDALVNLSEDGGAYVQAWVWIDADEVNACPSCNAEFTDDGEGYDGKCGSCADAEEAKTYAHSPDSCPSNHWNDGDDICRDCGKDLNPPTLDQIVEEFADLEDGESDELVKVTEPLNTFFHSMHDEYEGFPSSAWMEAVASGKTRFGYLDWINDQKFNGGMEA